MDSRKLRRTIAKLDSEDSWPRTEDADLCCKYMCIPINTELETLVEALAFLCKLKDRWEAKLMYFLVK